ncbi:unnamed protein product, partial [Scytosiphon promiscuus]
MKLIDIGANLSHEYFSHDLEQVIASAQEAGVTDIIVTGTDHDSNVAALDLSRKHPEIFRSTAGFHPHVSDSFDDAALSAIRELAQRDEVVAIGDTGLYFNRNFSSRESQLTTFEALLALATYISKPLF